MGSTTGFGDLRYAIRHVVVIGALGGLVAGIGMGVVLHAGGNMMLLVGALYGWPSVVGGWTAHLLNSTVLGVLFAVLVSHRLFEDQTRTIAGCVALGTVYAAAIGLVTGGIMLPAAINVLGTQSLPTAILPLPGVLGGVVVVLSVGVAHVVYGVLLGVTYGLVHNDVPLRDLTPTAEY
jgi:hypothetical protein